MRIHQPLVIVIAGALAVAAYAALGAVQILVLNPLAARPGMTLGEIHRTLDAAGESISPVPVVVFVVSGVLLASGVAAASMRQTSSLVAAMSILSVIVFGAPAYFAASFSAGMALADTFFISGADHSPWSLALYGASGLAMAGVVTLAVVYVARSRRGGSRVIAPVAA